MKTLVLSDKKLTTVAAFYEKFQTAQLLKYSPERRCLFQVRIGRDDYFVKIYPKKFARGGRGEKIHRVGQHLWLLANVGRLNFRVPAPVRWETETRSLWQKELAGIPAIEYLKRGRGGKIAFEIGRSIAGIAEMKIAPPRTFDWAEQMNDSCEFAAQTIEKFPALAGEIERLLSLLDAFHRSQSEQKLVPAHGDMHIDQWLFDGENLGLLDFEDFSFAEAERDLAFFAVQIETEYGAQVCAEKTQKDLLAGFRASGANFYETRFVIYKAHKWLSKSAKAAKEIAAKKMLERAFGCLRKI